MLINLLGNAIKFTSRGQIVLALQAQTAGTGRAYRFSVTDTGPGIAEDTIRRLFQPFVQADESTSRKHGGTGLGLAIASRIVEQMGGELSVDSVPGAGATFWFEVHLPAAPPDLQPQDNLESGYTGYEQLAPAEDSDTLDVLVVEDNPVNQLYCQAVLERLGHRVSLAGDGFAAVEMAATRPFDLILMDCQMPILDGFQATLRLRQAETAAGMPRRRIVAVTATAMDEDRQRCIDAGMDDVLIKPFSPEDIARAIERSRNLVIAQPQ